MTDMINRAMEGYLNNCEISCAALRIMKNGQTVFENKWGYSSIEKKTPVEYDSIYRMMSMTKVITAVAVMICCERGLLYLDMSLSEYIPQFFGMKVCDDERYVYSPEKLKKLPLMLLTFSMKKVKTKPAEREMTIRDLLSHSSGLQQGLAGLLAFYKENRHYGTLKDFVLHYSDHVLDFSPGEGTGYSPIAGFDILGYLVSLVSGMSLEDFIQKEICIPLSMKDTTFFPNDLQKVRIVEVYKRKKVKLVNVTGTKDDIYGVLHQKTITYEHGSGGIYSTLSDFTAFTAMLLNNGEYEGHRILSEESVVLMSTEAPKNHLEPEPGHVWGLGVKIRQDPIKGNTPATKGTYGWSGAFGTHFFISPKDNLLTVFVTNRSDLNGAGSYISRKVEEMVFEIYGEKNE